jgi:two-component system CheB/CheR fusion protein
MRYAVAFLGPLFSALVQYTLLPEPAISPFVFFYFSVALVSWLAGRGPGLLSVALSALVANYMFVAPHRQLSLTRPALTATALFLISGAAVSLLCASFRNALLAARRTAAVLRRQGDLLRAKEAELETILERTPFMLTRCSRDLRYLYVSRAYAQMMGSTPEEVAGKPIVEVMGERGFTTIRPHVEAVLRGQPVEYESAVHFSGVGDRLLQVVYVPDRDQHDRVIGWVGSLIDVTEPRQAQEALRAAHAQLIEADRRKTEFLAMLSHELRNPLAPIRNSLYILERAVPGGDQARRAQRVIDRQVNHLARLVDDLLDVMRISRGKTHLKLERLDVGDLVAHTVEDHRSSFANNGLELEVRVPAQPIWVQGDRVRVAQLIGNLLNNASKFTEHGGKATVSLEEDPSLGQVVIRVRDTGAGIAPEMLPRLFEPFIQADRSLARSRGGLGLGLALVKGLAEMHDGTVSASSEGLGKGAEFTVRLPLDPSAAPTGTEARAAPQTAPSRRVLVIEDNVDAADTLQQALELGGHAVEVAYTAESGLEKARAFKPDVVFCDIGLPGMDGYEVARALRADPALQATMLVALTGYAGPEDISRSREAGFHHHVAKPPSYEEIERILASVASEASGATAVH